MGHIILKNKIMKLKLKHIFEEVEYNHREFLKWKRKNVTIRGIKEYGKENGVYGSMGKGLYTAFLSNRAMAKEYGEVYYVVNAIPKTPLVVDSINNWEIWAYRNLYDKVGGKREFEKTTNLTDAIMALGYDGVIIKGREMVNFTPENILYFRTDRELEYYYSQHINEELTYRHADTEGPEDDEYEIGMVKEGNDGNYAYHVGDLKEKSESIGDKAHGARMLAKNGFGKASKTGHFGAGHFFFGSLEKAQEFQKSKNMPIYIIDFDKYNLYKPNNPEEFVSGVIELTNKLIMVPDNYINDPEFKQLIKDLSKDLPYFGINLNINKIYQITRDFVIDVTTNSNPSGDYLITRYLKAVNFEGIDFRNTKYDSFYVGSVIYDIKPNTVKLYK